RAGADNHRAGAGQHSTGSGNHASSSTSTAAGAYGSQEEQAATHREETATGAANCATSAGTKSESAETWTRGDPGRRRLTAARYPEREPGRGRSHAPVAEHRAIARFDAEQPAKPYAATDSGRAGDGDADQGLHGAVAQGDAGVRSGARA